MPAKIALVFDSTGGFNQCAGIYIQILAAVEITQETDTPEQIAEEVFKRQVARPFPVDFDTGVCDKFQFNCIRDVRCVIHHVVKPKYQPIICEHLGFCGVNRLGLMVAISRKAFDFFELTLPAFASDPDTPFAYLVERKHHPRQQVDCLSDENHITGKGIAGCVFEFSGAWRLQDERVRCEGLSTEHRAVVWYWGFKAFGVDAPVWELTLFFALLLTADTRNVPQDVSESAAEDVAFVVWHLQRFLDGIGESVACESEVLEHAKIRFLL